MKKIVFFLLAIFTVLPVFGNEQLAVSGAVNWETMQIEALVSLDLAGAGIRLPAGRTQGESILRSGFLDLIRPALMALQVDSSSTIADLIIRGELSAAEVENLALGARVVPPSLSPDMRNMTASYIICLLSISSNLLRHIRPAPIMRTLSPVSAANFTGIIIIASDSLPVHGMRGTALAQPCLFPRIWDSNMNLIYERNMLNPQTGTMVRYAPLQSIFQRNPSGLTPELIEIVGERPLRIFARGVFGSRPTDLIIDSADALLIISNEENRRLLSQGRVVFILDDSMLRQEF